MRSDAANTKITSNSARGLTAVTMETRCAGARQMRVLMRELQEIVDDGAALVTVIADEHFRGARMQLLDGR
jgi:hypothetical protein